VTVSLTSADLQGEFQGLESSFLMYRKGSKHCPSTWLNWELSKPVSVREGSVNFSCSIWYLSQQSRS